MKKTNIRSLHLNTSSIVREVEQGETYLLEKNGVAVAELKPLESGPAHRSLPDRDRVLARFPRVATDSGALLEEDRP